MSSRKVVSRVAFAPALALLALLLAPCAVLADAAGVISQVDGPVMLVEPGAGAGGSAFPARPLQVLAPGASLDLGRGAAAAVLCAGDQLVRLAGPTSWRIGPQTCAAGRTVPTGTFLGLVPGDGRRVDLAGSLLQESPSRGDDGFGIVPVLLSPRSPQRLTTAIYDTAPSIVWTEVRGALDYELVLGRGGRESIERVGGPRARCVSDRWRGRLRTCSLEWPWQPLAPGETVSLVVRAHVSDPDRPLREADGSSLRVVAGTVRRDVETTLTQLDGQDPSFALLRAGLFHRNELYNEAAAELSAMLEAQPQPTVAVQLADLHLGLGLPQSAQNIYQRAESLLPPRRGEDATRAAVHLGYGRFHMRGKDPQPALALRQFERAVKLFRSVGMEADALEAEAEADRARRKVS